MDILQIALIFLIVLLATFLSIAGFQVLLILKDLRKALERLNQIIYSSDEEVEQRLTQAISKEKPVVKKEVSKPTAQIRKPTSPRFFKKSL